MLPTWTAAKRWIVSHEGRKFVKYSAVSAISVACSVVLLIIFDGVVGLSAAWSATLATGISTIPSYELNRKWAWGKSGRGHLWREVVPFWVLAFIGWAFSTYSVKLAENACKGSTLSHPERTAVIALVYLAAYGVLWVGKFLIINKVLFVHHEVPAPAGADTVDVA